MSTEDFHDKPFDEGTLTKLQIFELFARGWLPVFLSSRRPSYRDIHIFDFFAGPGTDSEGTPGSPLLLLRQLRTYQELPGWREVRIHVHFFDEDPEKIRRLREKVAAFGFHEANVTFDIRATRFEDAFRESERILADRRAAKLLFIDQTGVGQVTPEVFKALVGSPTCDFLFFLSSSTLHRFRDHPAIKLKIDRPDDYYHVHRAALDYYRGLLPPRKRYFLAPFSIKKGSNIYGLIFGSAHPLGIDKFLEVAWRSDEVSGEADFAINREDIRPGELVLPLPELQPTKIVAFQAELADRLRHGLLANEAEVMQVCFEHGVKRKHAEAVLVKLKRDGIIDLDFRVPDIRRFNSPRKIRTKRK